MAFPKATIVILLLTPIFGGETPRVAEDLTVHEWGTFTSVAGEDGSPIDWSALGCKSDLPKFVNDFGFRGFKFTLQGTVRMETPVVYFYSPHELVVDVKVRFPQGLITEWYPNAEYKVYQKSGALGTTKRLEANLNGLDTSLRSLTGAMEWKNVKVQPDTSPALVTESEHGRYYAARETDAAPVAVGDQHEKFLFYRGVGRFPVPLSARLSSGGVVVENHGPGPIGSLILFENRGGHLGYRNAGPLQDTTTLARPSLDASLAQLGSALEDTLVEQGLFRREAQAMVATWKDSWFEEGSRLIYILPASAVDTNLPLQIAPSPSAIARVFVGRIELITPETVGAVIDAIAKSDWTALEPYSRFLEPILGRIYAGNPRQADSVRNSTGFCR